MFSKLHERLGTAGLVVAVVALVVALTGTAIAAIPGLNGKQKKQVTAIAKKYAGADGAAGLTGPVGPTGSAGKEGSQGKQGVPGVPGEDGQQGEPGEDGSSVEAIPFTGAEEPVAEPCAGRGGVFVGPEGSELDPVCNGEEGSPWTAGGTLPTEQTETGAWATSFSGETLVQLPFTVPLQATLDAAHVVSHLKGYNGEDNSGVEHETCPGRASNPKAKVGYLCVYTSGFTPVTVEIKGIGNAGSLGFGTGGAGKAGAYLWLGSASATFGWGTWAVTAP